MIEAMEARAQAYKDYLTAYTNLQEWLAQVKTPFAVLLDKYYDACYALFQNAVDNAFRATTTFNHAAQVEHVPYSGKVGELYIGMWKACYERIYSQCEPMSVARPIH